MEPTARPPTSPDVGISESFTRPRDAADSGAAPRVAADAAPADQPNPPDQPAGDEAPTAVAGAAHILADAATAIHAERDLGRLVEWVLEQTLQCTAADAAGLWLLTDGTMTWSRTGSPHLDAS